MIADITITEKSFGPKSLMSGIKFSIDDGEKIGVVGRNGVGKSTLFGILAGTDKDFTGEIIYKRGTVVVATAQEHHGLGEQTVLQYILSGLPEYSELSHIIETYPLTMGDDMKKIDEYTQALQRFDDKGFYQIEEKVSRELENFQLPDVAHRTLASLSGGQKQRIALARAFFGDPHLVVLDEPNSNLDSAGDVALMRALQHAREQKITMITVTQRPSLLQSVDKILLLVNGTVALFGMRMDVLKALQARGIDIEGGSFGHQLQ